MVTDFKPVVMRFNFEILWFLKVFTHKKNLYGKASILSDQKGIVSDQKGIVSDQKGIVSDQKGIVSDQKGIVPD